MVISRALLHFASHRQSIFHKKIAKITCSKNYISLFQAPNHAVEKRYRVPAMEHLKSIILSQKKPSGNCVRHIDVLRVCEKSETTCLSFDFHHRTIHAVIMQGFRGRRHFSAKEKPRCFTAGPNNNCTIKRVFIPRRQAVCRRHSTRNPHRWSGP